MFSMPSNVIGFLEIPGGCLYEDMPSEITDRKIDKINNNCLLSARNSPTAGIEMLL